MKPCAICKKPTPPVVYRPVSLPAGRIGPDRLVFVCPRCRD